ncbi:hypothetical protein CRE_22608 [Caenorhabditis remanei]|uniref:BTB domain-containing protein n=1 Tax=Caenorhabditis remanei TaxID=31234 RepID=E3N8N8_CAERE|nr:hypothetical protein CRE_22608 [Caenorhabditis remanei]
MIDEVIEYTSCLVPVVNDILDVSETNGVMCTWSGAIIDENIISLTWIFDWSKLKDQGVESLFGQLSIHSENIPKGSQQIDIDFRNSIETIETVIEVATSCDPLINVSFDFSVIPVTNSAAKEACEEMFAPSEETDGILIVEGMKLHVNKEFLSYQSEFFRALFSSNYKEGQMAEIPIKDVNFSDFKLLLSIVYPINEFPNDKTAEKLLELADRFIIPSVTHKVNYHLMNHSKFENSKLLCLADEYQLKDLLEKSIHQMNTLEKAKELEKCSEYSELSIATKAKLFDRMLKLI